jgi:N-acetyl-anhydromuramyl-L-alanine amidase AmpD
MIKVPQPDWDATHQTCNLKKRTEKPELIVIHHSGGHEAGDIRTLCGQTSRKVSADFYVNEKGRIYKLNPQLSEFYTFHAGVSKWNGHWDVNKISWGIECEHPSLLTPWPDIQVYSVAKLCSWLMQYGKLDIASHPFQGHASVAWPKGRKIDPWLFPWDKFSEQIHDILRI